MTTVTTRELRDGLSAYLRRVEEGERVVVLRGGRAVAAIVPLEEAQGLDEEARLSRLAARGLVVLPHPSPPTERAAGPRFPARGKPASAMVLEDRR